VRNDFDATPTPRVASLPVTGQVIVVGLNGSPTSWNAFCWSAGQAARTGGRIVAVFVSPCVRTTGLQGGPYDYAAVEDAQAQHCCALETEAAGYAADLGIGLTFVRRRGGAARGLSEVALAARADVVVVGRSRRRLCGGTASLGRRLRSRPDAPVLVVVA
jgi:nucleotide-binding universal stress UspA family protein